ncbi:hypothetical protein L1887_04236 [Cichorium endivia]|nr:hypothetical protein L1887_04236 [Cichorium endivia]
MEMDSYATHLCQATPSLSSYPGDYSCSNSDHRLPACFPSPATTGVKNPSLNALQRSDKSRHSSLRRCSKIRHHLLRSQTFMVQHRLTNGVIASNGASPPFDEPSCLYSASIHLLLILPATQHLLLRSLLFSDQMVVEPPRHPFRICLFNLRSPGAIDAAPMTEHRRPSLAEIRLTPSQQSDTTIEPELPMPISLSSLSLPSTWSAVG